MISLSGEGNVDGDFAMTIAVRKRFVAGSIALLFCMANASAFVNWLDTIGVLAWTRCIRDQYLTGTAVTVIAALLVLLPSGTVIAICATRCSSKLE